MNNRCQASHAIMPKAHPAYLSYNENAYFSPTLFAYPTVMSFSRTLAFYLVALGLLLAPVTTSAWWINGRQSDVVTDIVVDHQPPVGDIVPGELMVKFSRLAPAKSSRLQIEQMGGEVAREFSAVGWQQVKLPPGESVQTAIARYQALSGVELVQPNYVYRTLATSNDPRLNDLYGLNKIQAPAAWDKTTGNANVIVAIIDTGVLYTHEDLAANMWRNPGETGVDANGQKRSTNGIDDDRDGYVDDVFGVDTINHDSDPVDDQGHGTHVAGTIGAVGNNGRGIVGVNWNVRMMTIKTHDQLGNGSSASVVEGFQYATMMRKRGVNVRVTNNSWGGAPEAPAYDQALKDAIDAAGKAGILNVCAAGNSGSDNDVNAFYPASYDSPSIVSVAASDSNDNRASFSSFGHTTVDLAAPGVGILSTYGAGPAEYRTFNGTSMASPHVAGAAALLCAYRGALSRAELKAAILNLADPLTQWSGLTVTGGRLNVAAAAQSLPNNNALDDAQFFVKQQYLDFLDRDADDGGLSYWTNEVTKCGADAACVNRRRVEVAASFFIEQEFQDTGSFIYRLHKASFGTQPAFSEYMPDRNLVIGGANLASARQSLASDWVQRARFTTNYPATMTAAEFVNKLFDTAGLQPYAAERQQQINAMVTMGKTRAQVLQDVIEIQEFKTREYNPSFVLMEYFGYLRRDPDQGGYDFWVNVINNRLPNNYIGMVCAFVTSQEYQERFGLVQTHSNSECGS
jgi:subtilisin family serine protease